MTFDIVTGIIGLHHVQLAMPAGQESRAREFYSGVLGLVEEPKPANLAKRGGVWFKAVPFGFILVSTAISIQRGKRIQPCWSGDLPCSPIVADYQDILPRPMSRSTATLGVRLRPVRKQD